jgi:hypothetical protein
MVKKSLAEQERLRMLRSKLKTTTPTDKPVTEYTVTGVLKASRLFSGGATGKKRYMVLGKDGTRIKAYAQSVADVVDLSKYEGKYVGIYGPKKFDKKLSGLYIVNAEAVTVLEEQVDLPEAPSAKVKAPPVKPKKKQPSNNKDTKAAESGKPQRPDFSEQEEEMEEAKEAAEEADVVEPADIEVEEVSIDDLPDTGLPVVESSAVSPVAEAEYE